MGGLENMSNGFDDNTKIFMHPPDNGQLFGKVGTIVFPSQQKMLSVLESGTKVSIFVEKRRASNIVILDRDGNMLPDQTVDNYLFLFMFEGEHKLEGATAIFSFLDPARSKIHDNLSEANKSFNKIHRKLNSLKNHEFVYHGGRNEG
jgi:hypothetical protein